MVRRITDGESVGFSGNKLVEVERSAMKVCRKVWAGRMFLMLRYLAAGD